MQLFQTLVSLKSHSLIGRCSLWNLHAVSLKSLMRCSLLPAVAGRHPYHLRYLFFGLKMLPAGLPITQTRKN